ncbi:galanin receptor 2a-like [Dreissena polymorpha]|uniref:galanin receptor 2a-like n=1 Tax=Dreissena polymorpha TaxID=45954 RepID=UPI0022655B7E|nr:galanin receptor 2a-like [Dreissena polymorpha]
MDATTKFAINVTLINVTEQETFNTTLSNFSEWSFPPDGYYKNTSVLLWKVIPPILILIGTIGNAMTIFVLLRQKKMTSTAVFLFALALSDTFILFCGPMPDWLFYTWGIDIESLSNPACKAILYLEYCSIHLSSWLIVVVTLERTACVMFPHKMRLGCSPRNAGLIIVTIVLAVFGINIILLVIVDVNEYTGWTCYPSTKDYYDLFYYVYGWIDLTLTFGAPFPLLLIGNVIIVVQLARSRSRRQRMNISGQTRDTRPVSILLIGLCVLFCVTMSPVSVFLLYSPYQSEKLQALMSVDPYTAWYDTEYWA